MAKAALYILIYLLVLTSFANAESLDYLSKESVMDISIEAKLKIIPELKSGSYVLDYVKADMSLFPRDDTRQQVLDLKITPEPDKKDNSITFIWKEPLSNDLAYRIDGKVRTLNQLVKVGKKIDFPVKGLDKEYEVYTKPSKNIDSDNENIIRLASELAQGEDDMYGVVFNVAKWVRNNIVYNLDTLTADVSQPSSWVLNSKYGVCDEISSLFIGLLRAVGIPARYVSGVAYTNWKDTNDWGPHAWAEVYFPGYGWVPFDITYDQFGYIDLSHIKLKESVDSDDPSTLFQWQGRNVNVESSDLDIKTALVKNNGRADDLIILKAEAIKDSVSFGSYNLIEATIENSHNYYVPINLGISKTKELKIEGEANRELLLKPFETKKVYWKIMVEPSLLKDYVYTFPVMVFTTSNITSFTKFDSKINEPLFSSEDIDSIIKQNAAEDKKTYSRNIDLSCSLDKSAFYSYEQGKVICLLKNTGNTIIKDLDACLKEDCKTIEIGITQEKSLSFNLKEKSIGKREIDVKAENNDVSKRFTLKYEVLDEPSVDISSLQYPSNVSYKDLFTIKFILKKESYSIPQDIKVRLIQNSYEREWSSLKLENDEEYNLNLKGSDLSVGTNDFKIVVEYKDNNDRTYSKQNSFIISLNKPKITQRLMIWLNELGKWIEKGLS